MTDTVVAVIPRDDIKKGHVCPPSSATHPADRWETALIYSFICKFTKLKQEIDGLECVSDLEDALLFNGPHPILEQVLARFMLYLRPQTRNIGPDLISGTVQAYFAETFAKGERSTFWDERQMLNLDPFNGIDFFSLHWGAKLRILRQLVEWQLCYSTEIKGLIDRAWGIVHMKHKKSHVEITQEAQQLPDSDPYSRVNLAFVPLGQDAKKKRYWAVDASPRLYVSTNPWKVTATFVRLSSTKEDYLKVIQDLKENAPPPIKEGERRPKTDIAHFALIKVLASRIEAVDAELQRISKAQKKMLQKQLAAAQVAEMNMTGPRTRRTSRKPDYVYFNGEDEEEEEEEEEFIDDNYDDRMDDEADFINDDPMSDEEEDIGQFGRRRPRRAAAVAGTERRRSTRTTVTNGHNNRNSNTEWRGERRSSRLGATSDLSIDQPPPLKRARIGGSATPSLHDEIMDLGPQPEPQKATALRPNEVAIPVIAGKKKSKFWFYAVEPMPGAPQETEDPPSTAGPSHSVNGGRESVNGSSTGDMSVSDRRESEHRDVSGS